MAEWLVPEAQRELTPFRYHAGYRPGRVRPIELVVIHWTASPTDRDSPTGADPLRIRRWLRGESSKNSTHMVACRDGGVIQGAPLSDRTWHAGGTTWAGRQGRKVRSINSRSIGFDLENVGPLKMRGGGLRNCYEGIHHGQAEEDEHGRLWEPYSEIQIATMLWLVGRLVEAVPVLADFERWVGHEHIKDTKQDPGQLFPWLRLHDTLEGL